MARCNNNKTDREGQTHAEENHLRTRRRLLQHRRRKNQLQADQCSCRARQVAPGQRTVRTRAALDWPTIPPSWWHKVTRASPRSRPSRAKTAWQLGRPGGAPR